MSDIALPPQPKPADYVIDGKIDRKAFEAALGAWREVCREITRAADNAAFWNGRG